MRRRLTLPTHSTKGHLDTPQRKSNMIESFLLPTLVNQENLVEPTIKLDSEKPITQKPQNNL